MREPFSDINNTIKLINLNQIRISRTKTLSIYISIHHRHKDDSEYYDICEQIYL